MIGKECQSNFNTFMLACKADDVSLVACKDSKGREFQVLCILAPIEGTEEYVYLPFAFMITPTLYTLVNKVKPFDNLKGDWVWEE